MRLKTKKRISKVVIMAFVMGMLIPCSSTESKAKGVDGFEIVDVDDIISRKEVSKAELSPKSTTPAETPTPTYQPIQGKKVVMENEVGKASVTKLTKEIKKENKKIRKVKQRLNEAVHKEKAIEMIKKIVNCVMFVNAQPVELPNTESSTVEKMETSIVKMKQNVKELKNSRKNTTLTFCFNPKDITQPSNVKVSDMQRILEGTELYPYAETYVKIEEKYGINAIVICSISALESCWGTSRRAKEDHNLTGFGVYTDESVGINAGSGNESLLMTAKHLAENYIPEDGMYYEGLGIDCINLHYAASYTWGCKVESIGYRLMERLN